MPGYLSSARAALRLLAVSLVCVTSLWASARAQTCSHPEDPAFYNGYTVKQVAIDSPLAFMPATKSRLAQLQAELPLRPDSTFSADSYSQGVELIIGRLRAIEAEEERLFKLAVVVGGLKNCDEGQARRLDVVYQVVSIGYSSYFGHTFEVKSEEIERPAVSGAVNSAGGRLMIRPFAGYNRTRRGYGGAKVLLRAPGGVFDSLRLVASGSSAGNTAELDLIGARQSEKSFLKRLEYNLGYRHSDAPADGLRLREGKLMAQMFAASKPLGAHKVVLRYGLSLEGGNQQTGPIVAPAAEKALANSGYGSLKAYFGATARASRWAMAGSYGMQAGARGVSTGVDFVKHIADVSFAAWLSPRGGKSPEDAKPGNDFNKPFEIEARFTAGKIQQPGLVPVVERFFGGNEAQDFIAGDNWRIRSAPFIRSIPQNRLNAADALGPVGGDSFCSFNLTLARPLWGRPIIPRELREDPEFDRQLQSQMKSARKTLALWRKTQLPEYRELLGNLDTLIAELKRLNALIESLAANAQGDLPDQLDDAREAAGFVIFTLTEILKRVNANSPQSVGEGFNEGGLVIVLKSKIPDEVAEAANTVIETLKRQGLQQDASNLASARDSLLEFQKKLLAKYEAIDGAVAERQADEDMSAVNPILNAFLRELNLVSVSPVFVFDVARLWPDSNGARFGVGGGVRITLVNFNVTVGYAINPNPRLREGRGALIFSIDVTELFR